MKRLFQKLMYGPLVLLGLLFIYLAAAWCFVKTCLYSIRHGHSWTAVQLTMLNFWNGTYLAGRRTPGMEAFDDFIPVRRLNVTRLVDTDMSKWPKAGDVIFLCDAAHAQDRNRVKFVYSIDPDPRVVHLFAGAKHMLVCAHCASASGGDLDLIFPCTAGARTHIDWDATAVEHIDIDEEES